MSSKSTLIHNYKCISLIRRNNWNIWISLISLRALLSSLVRVEGCWCLICTDDVRHWRRVALSLLDTCRSHIVDSNVAMKFCLSCSFELKENFSPLESTLIWSSDKFLSERFISLLGMAWGNDSFLKFSYLRISLSFCLLVSNIRQLNDRLDHQDKNNAVYKIPCQDSNVVYVG